MFSVLQRHAYTCFTSYGMPSVGYWQCNVEINAPAARLLGCSELIFSFSLLGMTHP